MLPKEKRLNLKKDFRWVAVGRQVKTRYLRLFLRNGDNQMPKVGIAVSGKSFKKSSLRNKARRVASAAIEALYSRLPASLNIVILPKPVILEVKSKDVLLDLEEKLRDEKIIN